MSDAPDARGERPSSTLSALRHPEFRLLFGGLVPAGIGFWMQEFALGWFVVQLAVDEGNPAIGGVYLGLRSVASAVPYLTVGLFAGVFADRMDRRRLLLATRLASASVALALTILVVTGNANLIMIMILSALSSAAYVFDPPGRQAILPRIVPTRDLFSAMGLVRATQQASQTFGPLIAGVLIVPVGVAGVALSKVILMLTSVGMLWPLQPQPVGSDARTLSVVRSLGEGLAYIWRDDLLRWAVILQISFAILGMSFLQLLPAFAVDGLGVGATELSWLVAAVGAGTLAGAFVIASLGNVERRGAVLLGVLLVFGACLALFGLQRELIGAIAIAILLGVLLQLFIGGFGVTMQIASPDRLRGRIMGTQSIIFQSFSPIGVLVIGSLGSVIGIAPAMTIAGIAVAVAASVAAVRVRVIRDLRRDDAVPPSAER